MNRQDRKEEETGRKEGEEEEDIEEESGRSIERIEPGEGLDDLARRVIGAAIEVQRHLGPGYLEGVHEDALAVEFGLRNLCFERQRPVSVLDKGRPVGEGRLDFLVEECLILELKAVDPLISVHRARVLSYLKATRLRLGLLVNFKVAILKNGLQRVILA